MTLLFQHSEESALVLSSVPSPLDNQLLASLNEEARLRIFPHLKLIQLPLNKILYQPNQNLHYAFFPTNCIVSLHQIMKNGSLTETAVVGSEGMVGISLITGGDTSSSQAVVYIAGSAYKLSKTLLKREFKRHQELLYLSLRYVQSLLTQKSQTAVCNRHHTIFQQLCRLLLLTLDRLSGNQLIITQELIANMLGVRREGITEAACKLQKLGVIEYHRGKITVLDRDQLELLVCECYAVVKIESDRLSR